MDGAIFYNNFSSNYIAVASSENGTQLERYQLRNAHLPDFLVHSIPSVYFTFGAVLNMLLFTYVVGSGRWKTPIFTVIGNMAIADAMVCIAVVLWAIGIYPVIKYTSFEWVCHLSLFLGFGGSTVAAYTLVFFACLRFYQLAYPLAARARVTCSYVLKWLILIWTIYMTYGGVVYGILYRPKTVFINGDTGVICEQIGNRHAANIGFLIIGTIIPSVSIAGLHSAKYFAVAKSQKDVNVQQERRNTDARAVSIVILMYIICWFPINTYSVLMGIKYTDYHMFQDNIYLILVGVTACNSTFNPIIYCIAAKTVRDDLIRFIFCRRKADAS